MTRLFLQYSLSTLREEPWLSIWSGLPFTPINVFIMSTKGSNDVLPLIIECCWGNLWNWRLRSVAALTWWQSRCWGLSLTTMMNKWVNLISKTISLNLWGAEWMRYKCSGLLLIWQRLDLVFWPFLSLLRYYLKEKQWRNKVRSYNCVLSESWNCTCILFKGIDRYFLYCYIIRHVIFYNVLCFRLSVDSLNYCPQMHNFPDGNIQPSQF